MGRKPKLDDVARRRLLKHLSENGVIGLACAHAHVSDDCLEDHRAKDKAFDLEVKRALAAFGDSIEQEFLKRVMKGVPKPVFYKGKLVRTKVVEYSDTLLLVALRRHKPEYRDKQTVDLNHSGGVLVIEAEDTPEKWEHGDSS